MAVVQAAVGTVTISSATQFEVTDAGAFGGNTPKGILVWSGSNSTTDTVQDHGYFGMWGATEDDIVGCHLRHKHDSGTTSCNRTNSDGDTAASGSIQMLDSLGVVDTDIDFNGNGVGSNPGPITNGWRLDCTQYTKTVVLHYMLVGGDDLECTAISRRINDATESFTHEFSKTDRILGITFYGHETTDSGNHLRSNVWNSFGVFASNDGGTTWDQAAMGQRETGGVQAQDIIGIFSDTYCAASSNSSVTQTNDNTREASVTDIDSIGIEVTRNRWGDPNTILFMWVISIPSTLNVWAGNYTLPTSGGTFTPSSQPGFTPGVYGLMASGHTNTNTYEQVEGSGAWSFGVQDTNGNKGSASLIVEGEMLNIEDTYARSLTSTNFLDHRTVSTRSESVAAQFSSATFIGTGIEVSSPTGTFGGNAWAFAFELADDTPISETLTETLSLTDDAPVAALSFNETLTDSLAFTSEALAAGPLSEILSDSLSFTDSASVVSPFYNLLEDTLVFGDTATGDAPSVPNRGGRTIETVREMRRIERMSVLAQQDQMLLEFLKRELSKL